MFLQYGYEQGDGYFREVLAGFLSDRYESPVSADQLFVSNGVSQALDLICTLFTRPGDLIFTEEPSYFLALRIFEDHHLEVSSVPTDENEIVLEALEELSREHRFLILADEVYHLLSYDQSPPPSFGSFCSEGDVFSLSSFSKILAPGLRLGWHLDYLRSVYSERLSAMGSELRENFDGRLRISHPWGGFFFWINLPEIANTQELLARAREHGVKFVPGVRFSTRGEMGQYLRLSFSYYDSDAIREGVRRLAAATRRQHIDSNSRSRSGSLN